jgi:hypothetical protein
MMINMEMEMDGFNASHLESIGGLWTSRGSFRIFGGRVLTRTTKHRHKVESRVSVESPPKHSKRSFRQVGEPFLNWQYALLIIRDRKAENESTIQPR